MTPAKAMLHSCPSSKDEKLHLEIAWRHEVNRKKKICSQSRSILIGGFENYRKTLSLASLFLDRDRSLFIFSQKEKQGPGR